MIKTLMRGLVEKDMQAVINTYDLKPYYYPTLFPLKETYTLTWKALEAQVGLKIAADLVARGATIDKKTRDAIARLQGDIPKIAVKRTKNEDELTDYEVMLAMTSQNPDLRALVEAWAEDTNFCWTAVAARLEWMALQEISLGKITPVSYTHLDVYKRQDISKVVSELRNGRLSVEPNTKEHVAQYDPKLHDINDTQKRPDKLVVIDKDSDEYGEVKNVNPNVEQTTEQGFRIEPVALSLIHI